MSDTIGMTETTQMAMIGELRKVLKRWHFRWPECRRKCAWWGPSKERADGGDDVVVVVNDVEVLPFVERQAGVADAEGYEVTDL